ncbi:DUF5813 family protein [Haloquadratum walsbyi]|uniref:Uncharacterized protein n=1 Tax=Haloquadratum walsbyi J07HQW2 TaxID=1238425 RepID=U1NF80_9EURY|nr:DUF5813 family protein [Haloquadratum walsbyi]ERG95433.1 MAG: hypothetical protein J07HQW2_01890 [Haloquadratum walsbyi J07HQW2]
MSDIRERTDRATSLHDSIEPDADNDGYVVTTTVFDGYITVDTSDDGAVFSVLITVPMIDAVVDGDVADPVQKGWVDTFGRRMADSASATRGHDTLDIETTREDDTAVVETTFTDIDPSRGIDDAVSLVEFAEGTYVEGVIPGYDYTDPVTQLIQRASDAAGGKKGGTPL